MHMRRLWSTTALEPSINETITKLKHLFNEKLNHQALIFYRDQLHGNTTVSPSFILPSVIKACSLSHTTHHIFGFQLQCYVFKSGFDSDPVVTNSLISMHAKFLDTKCAATLFDHMPYKDSVSWNAMINCFIQNGCGLQALDMFAKMYALGFVPKSELIASLLSVCVRIGCVDIGRLIHAIVVLDERIEETVFLSTALVDLYWRCRKPMMAFYIFDMMEVRNEVSWTAMISGCATHHNYETALNCFISMQDEGVKPNRVTLIAILPASTTTGGKQIHGYAFRHGYNSDIHFLSALIHMYCKSGETLDDAKLTFELSNNKDVVLWSSIIAGCSQNEDSAQDSIRYFNRMQKEEIAANYVTMLGLISACTNLSSISHGRVIHGYVLKCGLVSELSIGNCLVNMYSKCGSLTDSHQSFKELSTRDCISWGAIINAYALHGCGKEALNLLYEMQMSGIEADSITYLAVLSACNHAGLVEEGHTVFNKAVKVDNQSLSAKHYACHIDLLGRAGKLEDACDVIKAMPMKPSIRIWSSLVSACKLHGKLGVAEVLAHQLLLEEPKNAALHTLLSMVCAESGNWPAVEEVRNNMRVRGLRKSCGFSRIEVENELIYSDLLR
ncbi:pentatricopeptide repeat-containing protein At4g31070, mitochondrial [Apium graveolens]|uniref:pentatricopeptide repeat-containing protein At4g31070, mitochondrial n=1 Tax=Apium graveolens TaxID=4045 RepID=UPI003D78B3EC